MKFQPNRLVMIARLAAALLVLPTLLSAVSTAAELKPQTREAFAHYTQVAESRMQETLKPNGQLLFVDGLPESEKRAAMAKLRNGEVVTTKIETRENGKEIAIPKGMVHQWVGTVFVPGATVKETFALLQDYDHHKDLYKPEVMDSKLLGRDGNDFRAYMRFYKKKIIAVVLNTEHRAQFAMLDPARGYSNSHTTRIAEVENPGKSDEREKPVGNDNGFLWALNSYWRMEERDGGVYIQCETISLTRDIPAGLGWVVKPFITEVPKESLFTTLNSTRIGLQRKLAKK